MCDFFLSSCKGGGGGAVLQILWKVCHLVLDAQHTNESIIRQFKLTDLLWHKLMWTSPPDP